MWTLDEQLLLATLSRGQRELVIQARLQRQIEDPPLAIADDASETENPDHQQFMRQINELVFDADMPLAEKQRLLYSLYCRCCGVFGGATAVFAKPVDHG